jgi:hypothetical protein
LHWCSGGLLWGRNWIEGWKLEGTFLKTWLNIDLFVDKTYQWESVGYLQSKASSPSPLNFKTQSAFAIYTLCFYSCTNIIVIFS